MFAVVLVGGFGTRLRPLTNVTPKPMLPVVHRPIVVRLVEHLAAGGITDVVLALGFLPEPFSVAFPDGRHAGVRIHYAVEPEPLDTAGAIAFAARTVGIDSTFVVANGDIITDLALERLLAAHRELGAEVTIHLTPVDDPAVYGVVEVEPSGIVRRFVEKPSPGETDSNLINAGTYVMEPSVLDRIPAGGRVSLERSVFPALVADGRLAAVASDDYWIDAGRPEHYLQANLDLVNGARGRVGGGIADTARIDAEAIAVESVIGAGAAVAAGATVSRSVLLPGATVAAGAVVDRSIVAGAVGAGASVAASVIGVGYEVPDGACIADQRLPATE